MQNNQIDLSGFEHPVIDGWMRDLNTAAYLLVDTPAGEEERLVVMGNDINNGAYQDFAVLPGYVYELSYKLAFGGLGTMNLKVNEGTTTIASDSKTTNGSYMLNFTPTASTVRVHYAGNVKFMLNYIQLEYLHTDTIVTVSSPVAGYRYGFGGQEKDDEISGTGNSYTAEFWQYSPRIAKRWNIDPMTAKYPWQSPYSVFNNNPTYYNDPLGLEGQDWIGKKNKDGTTSWKWDENVKTEDQLPDGYTKLAKPGTVLPGVNGMDIFFGDNGHFEYLGKTEAGNYVSQEGIELQFSGEDEANAMFKMKMKGLAEALDNLKLTLGAVFAAPWVAGAAILSAPVWTPIAAQGLNYTLQGARLAGQYSLQGVRGYHNTFGKTGGYLNIGTNYFIQSGQTGSMNPMNHNTFGYIGSAFTPSSMSGKMAVGASGGLINYTPSDNNLKGFWNRNVGITLVDMMNGGIAPIYQPAGKIGTVLGGAQQIVGGRAINHLEATAPEY